MPTFDASGAAARDGFSLIERLARRGETFIGRAGARVAEKIMKLTDLHPRWALDADIWIAGVLRHDEAREGMGLTFECPCCLGTPRATRLGVFLANPIDGKPPSDDYDAQHLWTRTGDSFEDLSLSPSIDASASGHWHGFITNGEVT